MRNLLLTALLAFSTCHAQPLQLFIGTNSDIYTVGFSTSDGSFSGIKKAHPAASASFLAISHDGKTLFSTNSLAHPDSKQRTGGVASYSILDGGKLEEISIQPTSGAGTCHVSIDQTGKALFSADYGHGVLTSYPVDESGTISAAASSIKLTGSSAHPSRQKGPHAHSIYSTPDNRHVYAADLGTDSVHCYALDAGTAKLTHLSTAKTPPGSGPRHIAIHPDGKRLFVLNELTCTLSTFARDSETGKLDLLSTTPVLDGSAEKMSCSEVRLSPDAKHLYTGNRDISYQKRDSISHFTVPAEAGKTPERKQVLALPISIPRHFTIAPDAKWIIAGGQKSNNLIAIKRDQENGSLTLTENSIEVPGPTCILIRE